MRTGVVEERDVSGVDGGQGRGVVCSRGVRLMELAARGGQTCPASGNVGEAGGGLGGIRGREGGREGEGRRRR